MKAESEQLAIRRCILTLLVSSFLAIISLVPVFAHADLVIAEPAPGTRLYRSPSQIRLTFSEPVASNSTIVVFGENFRMIEGLQVVYNPLVPEQLMATIPTLSPGQYTVQWKAISADRDSISGSYSFLVTGSLIDVFHGTNWFLVGLIAMLGLILMLSAIRWRAKQKIQLQLRSRISWQKQSGYRYSSLY